MVQTIALDPSVFVRRLTWFEALGLLAALVLGVGGWAFDVHLRDDPITWPDSLGAWFQILTNQVVFAAWVIVICKMVRPPVERQEPGFVLCLGLVIGSGFALIFNFRYLSGSVYKDPHISEVQRLVLAYVGGAPLDTSLTLTSISAVAAGLALAGTAGWPRATSTLDRIGRLAAGLYFVIFLAASALSLYHSQ